MSYKFKIEDIKMSHIERMKVEHGELKQKISDLNQFIYAKENNVFDTLHKMSRSA